MQAVSWDNPLFQATYRLRDFWNFAFQKEIPLTEGVAKALEGRVREGIDFSRLVCLLKSKDVSSNDVNQGMIVYSPEDLKRVVLSFNYEFDFEKSFRTFDSSKSLDIASGLPLVSFDNFANSSLNIAFLQKVLKSQECLCMIRVRP